MQFDFFRLHDRVDERTVLNLGHRAVDVIVAALAVARGHERDAHIDRIGGNDRRDRVVEIQVARTDQFIQRFAERRTGQRTGGENCETRGYRAGLGARDLNHRIVLERRGDCAREIIAIDRERGARRHACAIGRGDHERAEPAHLFFQDADRGIHRIVAQRIGAHELRKVRCLMSFGHLDRAHLDQPHGDTPARELPRSLAARESRSDNGYLDLIHGVDAAKGDRGVFRRSCKPGCRSGASPFDYYLKSQIGQQGETRWNTSF